MRGRGFNSAFFLRERQPPRRGPMQTATLLTEKRRGGPASAAPLLLPHPPPPQSIQPSGRRRKSFGVHGRAVATETHADGRPELPVCLRLPRGFSVRDERHKPERRPIPERLPLGNGVHAATRRGARRAVPPSRSRRSTRPFSSAMESA